MKYVIEIVDAMLIAGDGVTAEITSGRCGYVYRLLGGDAAPPFAKARRFPTRGAKPVICFVGANDIAVSAGLAKWFEAGCPDPKAAH